MKIYNSARRIRLLYLSLISAAFFFVILSFGFICGADDEEDSSDHFFQEEEAETIIENDTEDSIPPTTTNPSQVVSEAPQHTAQNVSFNDTDFSTNEIGGDILITKSLDESDISNYVIYYGNSATTKLTGENAIAQLGKTGSNISYTISVNTVFPTNATHLLVYTNNAFEEMKTSVSVALTDVALSNQAHLSGLTLSSGSLNPVFSAETTSYTASIGVLVQSITVTPTAEDSGASIKVNGINVTSGSASENISMSSSSNTITIQVIAADQSTEETYTTMVNRNTTQPVYLKASNTGALDYFGKTVAASGNTLVIGAYQEDSNARGVNGNESNNSATDSGAVYVFVKSGTTWSQQAYLKASNADGGDNFGRSIAISGNTIVVGADLECSNATGVNGDGSNNSAFASGAAYVFVKNGTTWSQQAYLKASNTGAGDTFGKSVAISGDTIIVGANGEDSNAIGINANESNNSASSSGATYVFVRSGNAWSQQAYLKASNTEASDSFGGSVAISNDTIVVGADGEDSNALGIDGMQINNDAGQSGAAYVFVKSGTTWSQQAYLKASNTGASDNFGGSVAISGNTIVVGTPAESSNATGVNGDQNNNSAIQSGAAYIFVRSETMWSQQAYLKASNTEASDSFGESVAISGSTIIIGASREDSNSIEVNVNQFNNIAPQSGAAYVFKLNETVWVQQTYLKASNTEASDNFGGSVTISDGNIIVSAQGEDSNTTGINGNASDNSAESSGAAYVFSY